MAGTQAVDRTSGLLVHVLEAGRPVTFGELSQTSGLAKSTTSRLLTALELRGLLRRDRAGAFAPGPVIDGYARRLDRGHALVARLRPALQRAVERTGESGNLAVARDGAVDLLDQVDGTFLLGAVNWVGRTVPPHASALGKVLLAEGLLPPAKGPLARLTPRTVATGPALAREIEKVRRDGFATSTDELEIGLAAVAVPVHEDGAAVAAVSLSGPTGRFDAERVRAAVAVLREEFTPGHEDHEEGAA